MGFIHLIAINIANFQCRCGGREVRIPAPRVAQAQRRRKMGTWLRRGPERRGRAALVLADKTAQLLAV